MQDLYLYNASDEGDISSMDMDGEDELGAETGAPIELEDEEEDFSDFASDDE